MYSYSLKGGRGGGTKGQILTKGGHVPLVPAAYGPMQDTLRLEVELASYYYSPCSDFQAPLIACNKSSEDGLTVWGGGYTLSK